MNAESAFELLRLLDGTLEQMVTQQRAKVLRLAREAIPYISSEDVLNPMDYPELKAHPTFDYEDGLLGGILAAQMALRAEVNKRFGGP